jgi:hypothetical protein
VGGSWGGVGAGAVAGAANERAKGREQLREVGDGADERAPPVGERRGKREGGLAVAPGCRLGRPRIERRGRELAGREEKWASRLKPGRGGEFPFLFQTNFQMHLQIEF